MKDLDFDELDRAVNSLITKPVDEVSDSPVNATVAPEPTQVPDSAPDPVPDPLANVDVEFLPMQSVENSLPTVPIVTPSPVVERPSTGRFMDVVHPSSDMRTSLVMPERTSVQSVPTAVTSLPTPTLTAVPVAPTPIVVPETPAASYSDRDEDADIDRISNDIANTLGQTTDESAESPFLPGTKVEKRPLGAFSTETPVAEPVKTEVAPVAQTADNFHTPLPAELQDDLLSVESDNTTQPEALKPTSEPIVASQPTAVQATAATTLSANSSISPQYQEQPNSGDQNNGAIYDTKAYHKAIAHPSNKKSGWMWVLWIAILLIVGAGAGAAVYFLVIPRL